jgi:hypothetical protein
MSRPSESKLQLGHGLLGHQLVDAPAQLLAAEGGQFGEQRRRVELEGQLAVAKADDLAVRPLRLRQDLVECARERAARALPAGLSHDLPQQITNLSRLWHQRFLGFSCR